MVISGYFIDRRINLENFRVGRLLEDLDAMAGNISYKHADDNNPNTRPLSIVTASVDSIDLLNELIPNRDLLMKGI